VAGVVAWWQVGLGLQGGGQAGFCGPAELLPLSKLLFPGAG
jgi:hypothetical protein